MKLTEYRKLIDSSVWLDYFLLKSLTVRSLIHDEKFSLFSSAISLHEIKKKLLFSRKTPKEISDSLDFIKEKSFIVPVSEELCEKSAEDSVRLGLSMADSIIYRSALDNKAELITLDSHFTGRKGAVVLKA